MGKTQTKKLAGAALIVIASTIVSRLSGYVREALITNKLGTGEIADAYNAAFLVPDLMFQLLLGGALAAALIPILSGYLEKKQEEEGWKVVGTFINITFIFMLIFCVLGMLFAPQLIPLVAGGLKNKGEDTLQLAVKLSRILFPSVSFLMLAGIGNGVLNSYNRFAAASFGPVIYNVGGILSLYFLGEKSPQGAERVAYGIMLSAAVYFLFQLVVVIKNLRYYRFKIYFKNPGFIRMVKLAIPSLISSSIAQVNLIVSSTFTTYAAAGSLTLFNTANKTWQLPLGIFAQSIGIALLPTMSARLAVGAVDDFKSILDKGMKTVLFMSIPSAIAFIVLRNPIIRTLFKFSENFGEEQVAKTGYILMFFSIALIAQSMQAILGRSFFAANDTKTPLYIGMSTIVVNTAFSYILYHVMGAPGMALANSISSVFYTLLLIVILKRKIRGLHLRSILDFSVKITVAALIMGAVLYPLNMVLPVNINSKISQLVYLGVETLVGIIIYFGITMLLKLEEAVSVYGMIIGRVRKMVGRLGIKF